jgi:Bacterial Ig-like domain/Bacterial Ig domain
MGGGSERSRNCGGLRSGPGAGRHRRSPVFSDSNDLEMKTLQQRLITMGLGLCLGLLAACGGGGGGAAGGEGEPPPPPPPPQATTVRVKVLDVLGFAKPGAAVEVVGAGAAAVATGSDGTVQLELAPDTDALLRISLPGHTQQFRPLRVARGQSAYLEARLMARAPALTLPDAAAGGTLSGRNAARLTLPPNALVDALSGAPVTGAVQVEMTPVNTASHEIAAFPGSMRGVSGSTQGLLATYGPVEYIFTQGGRKLALAAGKTAEIEMPLHATLGVDRAPLAAGGTMPFWSLNEATGVWNQEGVGTIVASRSATGLALRATVTHFSWWNPDHFEDPVTVNISFVFEDGVVPTVCCHVEGQTVPGFPGPAGIASTTLPPSGGSVLVNAPTLVIFSASGASASGPLAGQAPDVSVPAGAGSINVSITLKVDPNPPNPVITSPEAGVTTYTRGSLDVAASVSGGEPDLVELLVNGGAIGTLSGSQAGGYSTTWDTTDFNETTYQIVVRARRGPTVVSSAARTVVVDRTPPTVTARTPAPGANQVPASELITVTFSEPLDPASLSNPEDPADVRVALLQGGPGSGSAIPATATLSPDGRVLTLAPVSPLATNFQYAVRLQGLTDRAGNVLALVEWSFSVPLFALASPDLNVTADGVVRNVIGRPELALAPNGEPLVLWREGADDGTFRLQTARRIGANWVRLPELPPAVAANSFGGDQTMALDGSGQPVVAWTQTVANTGGCNTTQPSQLFAARFNGSAWVPLGEGALNQTFCSGPQLPRLKVDNLGRPVLAVAESLATFSYTMRVLRFEGSAWTLLGNVPPRSVPAASNVVELRLALAGNDPYVLSSENRSGQIDHFVSRLEGNAFVPVGPRVVLGSANQRAALVIDPAGRPVVAIWTALVSQLQVLRFEGTAWATLGPALPTGGTGGNDPSIVFDNGEPLVAWESFTTNPAFASRYNPATATWADAVTINAQVGTLAEWQRRAEGGPIWVAVTSGPFNSRLRVVTTDALP